MFCKNHDSKPLIPFLYYTCCPILVLLGSFKHKVLGLLSPLTLFISGTAHFRLVMLEALDEDPVVSPLPGCAKASGQVQRQSYEKRMRRKANGSFHPFPFRERSKQAYCILILEDRLSDFSNKLEISLHSHRNLHHYEPRGP